MSEVIEGEISSGSRVSNIMDMDYEVEDNETEEIEDGETLEDESTKSKGKSQIPSDGTSKKEEKEDSEEDESEEEEDDEPEEDDNEDDDESEEDKEKKSKKEEEEDNGKIKIKYKVDGVEQEGEFTEQEIASALSAQKAALKRITQLDVEKKNYEKQISSAKEEVDFLANEFKGLKSSFNDVIEGFEKTGRINSDPVGAVYDLLDKFGLDVSTFERAVFFHHIPEVAKFLDMSDGDKKAYLLEKKVKWSDKKQAALKDREKEAASLKAKLEEENSIKRQAGISEEEFTELKSDLESFGLKDIKVNQVVEWKQIKPFYIRAKGIEEKVPGADVDQITRILAEYPQVTDEMILERLGYKEKLEKEFSEKLKNKSPKLKRKRTEDQYEKEVDELFQGFRGR